MNVKYNAMKKKHIVALRFDNQSLGVSIEQSAVLDSRSKHGCGLHHAVAGAESLLLHFGDGFTRPPPPFSLLFYNFKDLTSDKEALKHLGNQFKESPALFGHAYSREEGS